MELNEVKRQPVPKTTPKPESPEKRVADARRGESRKGKREGYAHT